jgi:hypothetical protein
MPLIHDDDCVFMWAKRRYIAAECEHGKFKAHSPCPICNKCECFETVVTHGVDDAEN